MTAPPPLHPTLWRTCRALANRTRLHIFALLVEQPGQTVSAVATRLRQPLSVASAYLRTLEARGLLTVRRVGRRVEYEPSSVRGGDPAQGLVAALRWAFQQESQPVPTLFRLATAFTHPRRVEIFRGLQAGPQTLGQMQIASGISGRALRRHLRKLEARGFVTCRQGMYAAADCPGAFGRELARLAGGG